MTELDFSDSWTCPRCRRPTTVRGTRPDVAVAIAAVKEHHRCGHHAADRSRSAAPVSLSTVPMPVVRPGRPR